jgi:SAM-dependent methyltransferase
MKSYYDSRLHGNRLKRCYEIAPARIRQYLVSEVRYVVDRIAYDCRVLELGCGYGRVLRHLIPRAQSVFGIDISQPNVEFARCFIGEPSNCCLSVMDALNMGFGDDCFDRVICIQNGISAFRVDQEALIKETVRITKDGGLVMYSSYSDKIWQDRLQWFKMQADAGLIGEIDMKMTHRGVIVCKDGFQATTVSPEQFSVLMKGFPGDFCIDEVDGSSVFCTLTVRKKSR